MQDRCGSNIFHFIYICIYEEGFFQDSEQEGTIVKYSDVMGVGRGRYVYMWDHSSVYWGVLGVRSPGKFLAFRSHDVIP